MSNVIKAIKNIKAREQRELILTPQVDAYLSDHPNGIVLSEPVAERIKQLMVSADNHDRSARFGASSRGTCERRQVFTYLGMPAVTSMMPPQLINLFSDGTWRHMRWQGMGLEAGWFTEVEVQTTLPEYRLGVSADAMNDEEMWGFELKGTSALGTVIRDGIPWKHMLQMHTMMLAFDFDTWIYMAECKFTQNYYEVVVHRDEAIIREVKDELNRLNDAIEDERFPAPLQACRHQKGDAWNECPYAGICLGTQVFPRRP